MLAVALLLAFAVDGMSQIRRSILPNRPTLNSMDAQRNVLRNIPAQPMVGNTQIVCCPSSGCCPPDRTTYIGETTMTPLKIDFLFLDLSTCTRCLATDEELTKALDVLSGVLRMLGHSVQVNKVNITTPELAVQYRFVSSPTIRINGIDICDNVQENDCSDCGDLCDTSVDCRVFVYKGKMYEQPPAAMIVDGILRVLYGQTQPVDEKPYVLPDNLSRFFTASARGESCCPPANPARGDACCPPVAPTTGTSCCPPTAGCCP